MPIPTTDWEPKPADIAWQRTMIGILKPDSVWGIPANQSAFKIDKVLKTFCLVAGDADDETTRRVAKVFRLLDFTEVEPTEEDNVNRDV